ncbi:MAG TPA: oligopeptide/dipeptide ABC transporter ATP-binding protein [Burkholderiaceae bacterium]|nr:oligopeptide/dipeptide ABC transporter ATP-binding protein [Burkholderiaceae bacterium]
MTSPSNDPTPRGDELLRVEDLQVHFPVTRGVLFKTTVGWVKAVDGVSFTINRGETLGLVGESGCGKTTTSLAVLRMQPVTAGRIVFEGQDITAQDRASGTFRRRMQMVYQDPYGSLDPRMTVRDIVGEPLTVHHVTPSRAEYDERVAALLTTVGLLPAMAERYPHEFSGGQRQRIAIARALALEPSLVICDEPVSALDVSIQAQVINVLMELQQRLQLSYLFVAHDLAVVRHISHRVAVMYLGRIVEVADRDSLFRDPLHPYTQALLTAVPVADPVAEKSRARQVLRGEVPSVMRPPSGCRFHPRCPHAMDVCREHDPALGDLGGGRAVACHLHGEAVIQLRKAVASA